MDNRNLPHNMQGLLKFALEYTKSEDAPNASAFDEMDADRKQFLENAMKSMTVDIMSEFQKAIAILENANEDHTEEDIVEAIDIIRDYISGIDFANSFIKIGGSAVVFQKLKSDKSAIRAGAAYIIAEMSQNNLFSQQHFVELGVLPTLIAYLKEDEAVASSAMHAISSLIRQYEPGCAKFIELDGLESALECLDSQHSKVVVKTNFLIFALSSEFTAVRDKLIELGAIKKLANSVQSITGFDNKIESVLLAMNVLIESDDGKSAVSKTNIARELTSLIDFNNGKPECEEMLEYARNILKCFPAAS